MSEYEETSLKFVELFNLTTLLFSTYNRKVIKIV